MLKLLFTCLLLLSWIVTTARGELPFHFDTEQNRWTLTNGWVQATFRLNPNGNFQFEEFTNLRGGYGWKAPASGLSSPIRFILDSTVVDARSSFVLKEQSASEVDRHGYRQTIVLEDLNGQFRVRLALEMYDNQPVLRHSVVVTNLRPRRVFVRAADMLPYSFADEQGAYRLFRVNQWAVAPRQQNFETSQNTLNPNGSAILVRSGARGLQCAWLALRDQDDRGLFAGWEFDGRADASVRHAGAQEAVQLAAPVNELYHPLEMNEEFRVPSAFVGLYHGDWDEAGYRTQRFAEAALAKPAPDPQFPYVAWDSWGYEVALDEQVLRREAERAARMGMELFVVDLGWARNIGDWYEDPSKFPSGLRALSDYVHALGMKFGLHFALAEASANSPVLVENPDWTASVDSNYFGAQSLCLSHRPVKEWLVQQAVRMIDDYQVDWILQDGENMVKQCTKNTHTHDRRDSNYSNSVDGLDAVLKEIQRLRPNTYWENCEDGGNMMTFNMLRNYVTSITNDANGALGARQAVWGATYPFPPRYSDRYMGEEELTAYVTRSFVFGGPWVFMNRLTAMDAKDLQFAVSEIALFKAIRGKVRDGKVFRLTARPHQGRIDAIESYYAPADSAVAVVTRDDAAADRFLLKLRGLNPETTYRVRFQDDRRVFTMTGAQLMQNGVLVNLPQAETAEVVFVDPL